MFFYGWQGVYALIGIVIAVTVIVYGFAKLIDRHRHEQQTHP